MSSTKQKIFGIVVLVLIVLFGVGQFFAGANLSVPAQNPNTLPPTQVVAYVPTVTTSTPVEKGLCFAGSIAAPYRSDAYRCTVGNAISDPCFILPQAPGSGVTQELICGVNPASTGATSTFALQLTKPLPAPDKIGSSTPTNWAWLLELGDGSICSPFTGTRPFDAAGDVAVYSCGGGSVPEGTLVFGDLNNATGTWTANVGLLSTATSTFPPPMIASATIPVFAVWQ